MKYSIILLIQIFLVSATAFAQVKDVSGTVINEKNEGIPGATVKVKGNTQAAITDDNGMFTLKSISDTATITISAKGYQETEMSVADKTNLSITLLRAAGSDNALSLSQSIGLLTGIRLQLLKPRRQQVRK